MDDLLTTRQVQQILKVDRITIYRMLNDGRLKGVKIGQQWRFASQDVEHMLHSRVMVEEPNQAGPDPIFPTHCVQTIQDLFSDVSQIGALVVDQNGEPVTNFSRPSRFCQMILSTPSGHQACRECWKTFAQNSGRGSKFFTCFTGVQYIAAPIMDKDEQVGIFLAGQFYWQVPDPREEAERIRRLAAEHNLPFEELQQAAAAIPVIDPARQAQVEAWPFSAARAVQSILRERVRFVERLQQIANLTQL